MNIYLFCVKNRGVYMFGDVLRNKICLLASTSAKKSGEDAFWITLRNIAIEDIKACYPEKVDSNNAIGIYYSILKNNEKYIPVELVERLPSNGQEKYRVINRNLWSSNAFHPDGLANQEGIIAKRFFNCERRGERIIYQGGLL